MVKRLNRNLLLLIIIIISIFSGSIHCLEEWEKDAYRINAKVAIEDGGSCTVSTGDGRTITVVKNGVIQDYAFLYECGVTDAEIAQWQSASKSTVSNESTEEPNSSKSKTDGQESKQANTKESNQKAEEKKQEPSYTAEEIAAAWMETNRVESTCTETGRTEYTNSLTGETKTEELPLAEHKYAETERKEATCTDAGLVTYTCEVCGDTYSEKISPLEHDYEWVTTKEATLFTSGEEQYVCKNCGDISETKEITSTSPVFVALLIAGVAVMIIGIGFFFIKMKNDKFYFLHKSDVKL